MPRLLAVVILALLLTSSPIRAELYDPDKLEDRPQISQLTALDKGYHSRQRALIDGLARRNLGSQIRGDKHADLSTLQRLLDLRIVRPEQTQELQAMGVILGDLLAKELGMRWVIYEDKVGRSRALRMHSDEQILFPVTMISRRAEGGAQINVRQIFDKALQAMEKHKRRLPYT